MNQAVRVAALALILAAACSPSAGHGLNLTTADSAGVHLVRIRSLDSLEVPLWSSRVMFSSEKQDSFQVTGPVGARLVSDSELLVTNSTELILLGAEGQVIRRVGRRGDGPGEFRSIFRLGIGTGGTAFAWEEGSGRITHLRSTGEIVRIIPRLGLVRDGAEISPVTALADGRIIATYWEERPNREGAIGDVIGGIARDSAPLLVFDSTGHYLATLGTWPGLERAAVRIGDEPARLPLRFARSVAYAGRGETTVIGPTDSLDLSVYTGTALTLRLISPSPIARPSGSDIAEWERAILQHDPGAGPIYLRAIGSAPAVPVLPEIGGVSIDDRGEVWVAAYPVPYHSLRTWLVFSAAGAPLGRIELPTMTNPITPGQTEILDIRGDRIALLRVGESGELFVEVRALGKP